MAVSMADIAKLRKLTGAGMMDCKKALTETNNDIEAAIEIIRKKGQAVAAKREDREASEGCCLAKSTGDFAACLALKCETDFVAKNEGFVALTKKLLDAAVEAKAKSIDEVNNLVVDGQAVKDLIVEEIGKTGEKMELGAYEYVEAPATVAYVHFGNKLATVVAFNKVVEGSDVQHELAMQVAAMNPVAVDPDSVPEEVKTKELEIAIEKTKAEQVQKAVEAALKKAGFNLYIAENEEHINEGIMKGNITEADAEKIREIKKTVAEEKAANLPEQMIQNIANGRLNKFYKESCLVEQAYIMNEKQSVKEFMKTQDAELKILAFKRVNLNQD
ncbi:MAG: translation elongation factor Ts [Muribaculaceae bacterium]|nr:translation elongation factor Ts [Muribaculaceae bacterium]MDY3932483.1 translation elongation factor Ts [Muribaculaceae bacterium]